MTSQVEVPPLTGLIHFISGKRRVKYIMYVFSSFCQSSWSVLHFAYSLSKRCMVGKDISNTSKGYKLTHKIICFTFIC